LHIETGQRPTERELKMTNEATSAMTAFIASIEGVTPEQATAANLYIAENEVEFVAANWQYFLCPYDYSPKSEPVRDALCARIGAALGF